MSEIEKTCGQKVWKDERSRGAVCVMAKNNRRWKFQGKHGAASFVACQKLSDAIFSPPLPKP